MCFDDCQNLTRQLKSKKCYILLKLQKRNISATAPHRISFQPTSGRPSALFCLSEILFRQYLAIIFTVFGKSLIADIFIYHFVCAVINAAMDNLICRYCNLTNSFAFSIFIETTTL